MCGVNVFCVCGCTTAEAWRTHAEKAAVGMRASIAACCTASASGKPQAEQASPTSSQASARATSMRRRSRRAVPREPHSHTATQSSAHHTHQVKLLFSRETCMLVMLVKMNSCVNAKLETTEQRRRLLKAAAA